MSPPALEIVFGGRRVPVPPGRPFVIGRGPDVDLDVGHGRASRRHAVLTPAGEGWTFTDSSANGSYVGGRRVTSLPVTGPLTVRLGDTADSVVIELRPVTGIPGAPPPGAGPAGTLPTAPPPGVPLAPSTPPHALPAPGVPAPLAPPVGLAAPLPPTLPPQQAPVPAPPPAPVQQPSAQLAPPASVEQPSAQVASPAPVQQPVQAATPAPVQQPSAQLVSPVQQGAPPVAAPGPLPYSSPAAAPPAPPTSATDVLTRLGNPTSVRQVFTSVLRIGRLPDNDVVLDDLLVSRRHAELHRSGPHWRIVDLGSGNGTFVNGIRVGQAEITPRDVIGIGHALLQLVGDQLVSAKDTGDAAFTVSGAGVVTDSGKKLLNDVEFTLPGRSLLAVVGPSGAGKSTLLRALTGARPADTGEVRYAGRDLYAEYDELRHRIGLVPQDDVLHPQLTVRRALRYAARLRFPADVPDADRERRIDEVLGELNLFKQADQRIDTLSGGQRKRTSVALELLTKPSLLFLDEPTSGLDPGLDKSVMRTLRELADGSEGEGRTVVVVTHSVLNLDVCDRLLVLAPGGYVAYFGPPDEALAYFGAPDYSEMFLMLEREPAEQLAARFRASEQYRRYAQPPHQTLPTARRPAPATAPRQQSFLTQLSVLCRRYLAVIGADRQYAAFLLILPLALAAISWVVPGDSGLSARKAVELNEFQPSQLMLVLILGGALMGIAGSIRELVKERAVYVRERAIGLSLPAYLLSKLLVLGVFAAVQAAVFTVLALVGREMPDAAVVLGSGLLEVVIAVIGVTFVTMLVGLLVSAVIGNADRGMPMLVMVMMLELVVCGGLFPVHDRPVLEQLAWLVPSRWAFAMGAATADLNATPFALGKVDPRWEHTADAWLVGLGVLALMSVILVVVTGTVLRRLDPIRGRRRRS